MLLSRLHAVNFRQYETLDLRFKEGITGIVGKNGAGKSTILEAVLWCLFGVRAARTDKEGIRRQAASENDSCSVDLEFILAGKAYTLSRSLVGRNYRSEAKLTFEGQLDAVTTREVDDYVVRLIGLNLKGFLSSFFARQKELNALSDARPADRKDHLAKMLGVGRLDSAILLLKEEIKSVRQKIDVLSGLQIDPQAVGEALNGKKAEIDATEKAKAGYQEGLDRLQAEIVQRESRLAAWREKEQEYNRLENECAALTARLEAIQKDIDRLSKELSEIVEIGRSLESFTPKISGIAELEKRVADLRQFKLLAEEKGRLERDLSDLERELAARAEKKTALENEIEKLMEFVLTGAWLKNEISGSEKVLERLREGYQQISGEVRVIEDNLKVLSAQKAEIKDLGPEASCKMCLRPFAGELDEIERHFDEEILSLEQKLAPLRGRLTKIDADGKALKLEIQHKKARAEKLSLKSQEMASADATVKASTEMIAEGQKRMDGIRRRLKEIGEVIYDPEALTHAETELGKKQKERDEYIRLAERAARRPDIEKEIKDSSDGLGNLKAKLEANLAEKTALGFDREVYRQALTDLDRTREQAAETRLEIERIDGRIRLLASEAGGLARQLMEFERSRQEIGRLREELTYLEKVSLIFGEFRVHIIGRIRPALSKRTSQLFYEMTGGRYQEIELDEDYSLQIYDRGERFPISRFSGGEIDLANLCFRLAISVEMAATAGIEQSFIILDEIFGSQDTDRQRMIFDGLGRLKKRFRQIITISHIDDVKEMAENIIRVEVDSSGISHATAVENS